MSLSAEQIQAIRRELKNARDKRWAQACGMLLDEYETLQTELDRVRVLAIQGWESARALSIAHVVPVSGKPSATEQRADQVLAELQKDEPPHARCEACGGVGTMHVGSKAGERDPWEVCRSCKGTGHRGG